MSSFRKTSYLVLLLVLSLDVFIWFEVFGDVLKREEEIHFLDVGQGDAQLVRFLSGTKILIDAGPDSRIIQNLERVLPTTDRYIDLGIITHAQLDHFGGFIHLLNRYSFGAIIWNGREPDITNSSWEILKNRILESGTVFLIVEGGDRIKLADGQIDFWGATPSLIASSELNDGCLVSKIVGLRINALLPCDAGFITEKFLLSSGLNLKSDILKVGHHGSRFSSHELFLRAVDPEVAVIGVGAGNRYGHPTKETLARLAEFTEAKIFRTDQVGNISIKPSRGYLRVLTDH